MTPATILVILRLLCGTYGVDPQLATCIVARESDFDVNAVNRECVGLVQWRPSTREWLAEKAREDPAWLHGDIGEGPVQDMALMVWAIKNDYGSHWATFEGCGGEG